MLEVIAVMSLRITRLSSHFLYVTSNYQAPPHGGKGGGLIGSSEFGVAGEKGWKGE